MPSGVISYELNSVAFGGSPTIAAVIMTLHNSDNLRYFEIALASLLNQDTNAIIRIYLCVDGPIQNDKEAYLAKTSFAFFKIIRNPVNIGLARSLNRLIEHLEEEDFVFRMDADDISLPNRFSSQIEFMQSNPDISLVGCQAIDVNEDGEDLKPRSYPCQPEAIYDLLVKITPILHPTFCFRRSVFRDARIRYPDVHLAEDLALLVIMTKSLHKFSNIDEIAFKWRVGYDFLKRRQSVRRGIGEFKWYARAVYQTRGLVSAAYIFPIMRLIMRCLPLTLVRLIYNSPARSLTLKHS